MTSAVEWFSENSIWILMLSALLLAVLVFTRPRLRTRLERSAQGSYLRRLLRVCDVVIAVVDTIILAVILAAAVAIALSREGPKSLITPDSIKTWFMEHGLLILLIIAIAYLVYRMIRSFLPNIVESSMSARGRGKKAREDLARRVQTLSGALSTIAAILLILVAAFMVLSEIGVDVTPLLATAGVAGIAVGFGAQSLIKDVVTGIFILSEDQYNRGDVIKVAGVTGLVEDVTLRRTILRDLDGIVHNIPNGEITTASNYTKQYARLNLQVPVAYGEDLDHCIGVINRVGMEMYKDPAWAPKMRTAPQSLGVNDFGSSGIDIKVLGDTKPMMQWEVSREFRRRIKYAFDQEGIEIPWPHLKLYHGEEAPRRRITCPSCNCVNPQESKFCAGCGASLEESPEQSAEQPLPPDND